VAEVGSRVSAVDVTVFGGPSTVGLDVDFGPKGDRGSLIYGVNADPRLANTTRPEDLRDFDLAIVVNPSAPDYLKVYQKLGIGPRDWIEFASLAQNLYDAKVTTTFNESGEATIEIIASDIFITNTYTPEIFSVQYQIEDRTAGSQNFPIASSMKTSIVADGSNQKLRISLKSKELSGEDWIPTTGQRVVHLFVTIV
jgi:hypothetical protein